jgi:hypothetical protein
MLKSFPINYLNIRLKLMFSFVFLSNDNKMSFVLTLIQIIYAILGHEIRNKSNVILLKAIVFLRRQCFKFNNDNYLY